MDEEKLPVETFTLFFEKQFDQLEQIYKWPVSLRVKQSFQELSDFRWNGESDSLKEAISLKHHLTHLWVKADAIHQAKLARWIVYDWGGVRANNQNTIESHLERIIDENDRPLRGVASYSKILSAVDCTRYAIYDARVAACLNAIQLEIKPTRPIFFHYVPSRNKRIQAFEKTFPKHKLINELNWKKTEKDDTYKTYLQLLRALKDRFPSREIYHFEMILFGLAPELCASLVNNK